MTQLATFLLIAGLPFTIINGLRWSARATRYRDSAWPRVLTWAGVVMVAIGIALLS